jgi:queuine tRNA-ribosyltransferase
LSIASEKTDLGNMALTIWKHNAARLAFIYAAYLPDGALRPELGRTLSDFLDAQRGGQVLSRDTEVDIISSGSGLMVARQENGTVFNKALGFQIIRTSRDSRARAGQLTTSHVGLATPVFMPVGSQATVKTLTPDELKEIGIKIILANTYHLFLRPGVEIIRNLGGLHNFMGWEGAVLTDSGGFQIFSLARLRNLSEEGVTFRSHIDGSEHLITPETDIQLQEAIGADIIMTLDVCPSAQASPEEVKESTERTHRWAERCLKAHGQTDQALFGIVQGGFSSELRAQSAGYLSSLGFEGYAIGGLSLGEPKSITHSILETTVPLLPDKKPRYLMGVGSPEDILDGVSQGIDMFDCVLPTRVARNGGLFTDRGRLNIRNSMWKGQAAPVDPGCRCYTCLHFSAAYLHHLFRCEELLAYRLATIHNLYFMHNLMDRIRQSILSENFETFKTAFLEGYQATDESVRISQKKKWMETRNWPPENKTQSETCR